MHTLSAMTAGIRRNWIQAVMKNVRPSTAPDVARSGSVTRADGNVTFFSTVIYITLCYIYFFLSLVNSVIFKERYIWSEVQMCVLREVIMRICTNFGTCSRAAAVRLDWANKSCCQGELWGFWISMYWDFTRIFLHRDYSKNCSKKFRLKTVLDSTVLLQRRY